MFKISWFTSHLFSYNNTDNYSISFLEFHYRAPQVSGACAVLINGGEHFHERCHCEDTQLANCKTMCDTDASCKGYVKMGYSITSSCQIATTSSCTSACTKYDTGNTGSLVIDSDFPGYSYEGCFIKLGKPSHQ